MAAAAKAKYWVGFDLGGTKMLATVYSDAFEAVGRKRRKTRAQQGQEAGVQRVLQTIEMALDDAGLAADRLCGIGMAVPGPLDLDAGVILDTPNLGWSQVPIKKIVEERFACPVVIANDVDAGVYGEYRFGGARDARCVVGIFPGTGIGGGCVYEGRIVRGARSSCFEIGHIPVQPDGPLCGCGRRGCLEAVASRLAISAAAATAALRGDAPHLLEAAGTDLRNIRSGALAEAVEAGDRAVEAIIREAGRWIGHALAGVTNLMSPDVVVLGGGLVEAMPKLLHSAVAKGLKEQIMPSYEGSYRLVVAELGDEATAIGAAAWAQAQLAGG